MLRIYVAGSYSADNVMGVFDNMRKGMQLSKEVFLAGYAPFVPWFDYHFILLQQENERQLTIDDFYAYSMAWLEASDAVILVPGWLNSKGTLAEIEKADKLGIPVVEGIESLKIILKGRK